MKQQLTPNLQECQHEIVSEILKKLKQCGTVQASYGCLVGHVCMGVRISVFAPQLCNTLVSGLDAFADGYLLKKGADWYPFCLGGALEGGLGGGGGTGVSTPKSKRVVKKNTLLRVVKKKKTPAPCHQFSGRKG